MSDLDKAKPVLGQLYSHRIMELYTNKRGTYLGEMCHEYFEVEVDKQDLLHLAAELITYAEKME